jgi:threonine dehydratase
MADGLRTQSIGALNFEHIRTYVDDIITVKESEIEQAMRALSGQAETLAEPSGATAVAGFMFHADELPNTKMNVAVISGGNVDPKLLARLRNGGKAKN